jgi:PHD/YefM family antitoxin component YafN of YafNO toxin-antitoxin module
MQDGRVIITKHQRPHAVLLAFEEYERLISSAEPNLDDLTHDFDQLLARMQTPHARAAIDTLFSMSSAELGAAAVDQVARKP